MVDIQFLTAENRRGKKKEEDSNHAQLKKYNSLPVTMGGHNNIYVLVYLSGSAYTTSYCQFVMNKQHNIKSIRCH